MGVFKKLSGNNVRVTPLVVKKQQSVQLDAIVGKNFNAVGNVSAPTSFSGSGTGSTALVYNSIRQLYYSNHISDGFNHSGSIFNTSTTASVVALPGGGGEGRFEPRGPFFNSPQSSLPQSRTLPLGIEKEIRVFSIPVKTFGESIVPGTISSSNASSGILLDPNADGTIVTESFSYGNVIYDGGFIILTGKRGAGDKFGNFESSLTCSFSSSFTIYATEYICTSGPNEFNYSLNPTLRSGSGETQYNSSIINSPEFMPYVTTVGLYNENQELIAVGKLGQPIQLNPHTDTNFIIKLDR
tara:strand:+ start:380 stop:1273 length:894 start_codon:yes stop_codon:yes gene_type:complete